MLVSSDGTTLAIDKIEKEPREATVYNFEVEDFNSYFVSNLGIWVHNCLVLSDKNIKHFTNGHLASEYKNQVPYLSDKQLKEYLANNTFFNPSWSKETATSAVTKVYNDAIANGITNGTHRMTINGDTVVVAITDGKFKTAYGTYTLTPDKFK